MRLVSAALAAPVIIATALTVPAPAAESASSRTWYVSATAAAGGKGNAARPFRSLAQVEKASRAGDVIRILPSSRTLDGGIQLKRGQQLIGTGAAVTTLQSAKAPRLTNTTTRLGGDAVRLADAAVVRNVRVAGARRGAIYGLDVSGVSVAGNDVYGHNASCTPGFLIPEFTAPTSLPGVGVPIVGGLQNGWAGIMIDAAKRRNGTAAVIGNVVHHAECGDGIDVRTWGTASYRVRIDGNYVHSLRQGPDFRSLLAIGLQARDTSALIATIDRNRQAKLGNPDDPNLYVEGADSEGVFVNPVGPSTLHAAVTRNHYTNEPGVGGFSANGLEFVTMGNGSRASVVIRDSYFAGSTGDIIEEGALGTSARLDMLVERVTAERTTGQGNTWLLPFNNGDCLLAGSLGAGNDVRLTVRDSVLRDCDNNGLSIGSNVVNGDGPTKNISLLVEDSSIYGNNGGNLGVRNFTALSNLSMKVQRSDLAGSAGRGSGFADVSFEDVGTTTRSVIDLGGGGLGSAGWNCIQGAQLSSDSVRYHVAAQRTWWSQPGGPAPLRAVAVGGSLDTSRPLSRRPSFCRALDLDQHLGGAPTSRAVGEISLTGEPQPVVAPQPSAQPRRAPELDGFEVVLPGIDMTGQLVRL